MNLQARTGVALAALLTTFVVVGVAVVLNFALFPQENIKEELGQTSVIGLLTGFPVSYFVWSQVRQNKRLTAELRQSLSRDRLTNVATRDYFFARLEEMPDSRGIMLMVDVDNFKTVNDRYGHFSGDAVIRAVAGVLGIGLGSDDIVCRFGGEEFIVFLHEADEKQGAIVAERILRTVAAQAVYSEDAAIRVTVSIGGACKASGAQFEMALREADAALYRAKRTGRNRFVPGWVDLAA